MNRYIIGCDPGLTGAIAIYDKDLSTIIYVNDLPVCRKSGNTIVKNEIDVLKLRTMLLKAYNDLGINASRVVGYLEKVNAMKDQGVAGIFSFGDSYGCCRAMLSEYVSELTLISPRAWKKHYVLNSDKKESLALVRQLHPEAIHNLTLVKHHNRAEAILIARYGAYLRA